MLYKGFSMMSLCFSREIMENPIQFKFSVYNVIAFPTSVRYVLVASVLWELMAVYALRIYV
jgi:hypothetical protein